MAFNELQKPEGVARIFEVIGKAYLAEIDPGRRRKPLDIFNRSLGQLKRQQGGLYRELAAWLATTEIRQQADRWGLAWAWHVWCDAVEAFLSAERKGKPLLANKAFGANKPGNPRNPGFTRIEDAALLAEHYIQNERQTVSGAIDGAATTCSATPGEGGLSSRNVQRTMKQLAPSNVEELAIQAVLIKAKYEKANPGD